MARPHPGMNRARIVTWAAIFLALGTALNVAVAWGLVWAKPIPVGSSPKALKVSIAPVDTLAFPNDIPRPDKFFSWNDFAETYWQMIWDEPGPKGELLLPPPRTMVAHLTRSGWPIRSLQHQDLMWVVNKHRASSAVVPITPTHSGFWRAGFDLGYKRYAIFPVWPGFLINTLFFAAITGAFLWSIIALRIRARTRAGLCPACAYDRRGLTEATPCPECGTSPHR